MTSQSKMTKAIKGIYCTSVRKRVFISIRTKIVNRETVPIIDSVHCRFHTMHGCGFVHKCERIETAYNQWVKEGMPLW